MNYIECVSVQVHVQMKVQVHSRVVLTDAEVARVSVCLFSVLWSLFFPRESGMMASQHGDGWLLYLEQGRKTRRALPGLEIHPVYY